MKRFSPGWKMTVFVGTLLPLVCGLGVWQLDRGAQKRGLESDYLNQLTTLPIDVQDSSFNQRFQRVRLQGKFGRQAFLVDNQIQAGVTGYWIVQLFELRNGGRYLVNRGFVPGPTSRDELPALATPVGPQRVVGVVWPDTGLIPVLDEDVWPEDWPKRVQRLDVRRMAEALQANPVEIRLEPGQSGVAVAAPFATVLSDAKHLGYAATWFGLALALILGYLAFGVNQARVKDEVI